MPGRRLIISGSLLLLVGGAVGLAGFAASQAAGPASIVSQDVDSTRGPLLLAVFAGTLLAILGAGVLIWGLARRSRAAMPTIQRTVTEAGRRAGDATRRGQTTLMPHARAAATRSAAAWERAGSAAALATSRVSGALDQQSSPPELPPAPRAALPAPPPPPQVALRASPPPPPPPGPPS